MQAGIADEARSVTLMGTDIDRLVTSLEALCEAVPRLIELFIGIWLLADRLGWVCVAPIIVIMRQYFMQYLLSFKSNVLKFPLSPLVW